MAEAPPPPGAAGFPQVAAALVCPVYLPGFLHTAAAAVAAPTLTLLAVE
eukprot:SAG31_NODE_7033_length_1809_cov_1.126316_2_plen_48_part_01